MKLFLGLDVSKDSFTAALAHEHTEPRQWRRLPAATFALSPEGIEELLAFIASHEGEAQQASSSSVACLCAEATGIYSLRLHELLRQHAPHLPHLSIINPAWAKGTARSLGLREKTDREDARMLAMHALLHRPQPTVPRAPEHDALRELFALREVLQEEITATENRLSSVRTAPARKHLSLLLGQVEKRLEAVDREIDACLLRAPALKHDFDLLLTVAGIGRITALAILSTFGDLRSWSRQQIVAYAGLHPRSHQSGTSVNVRPRLIKGGAALLRKKLYMAAVAFVRRGPGKLSHQLLQQRGKAKMCSIGAHMRKLLLIARAVVISATPYDAERLERQQATLHT